jgi:hypothetical protein
LHTEKARLLFVIGPVPTIVSSRRETVLSLTIHFFSCST